jgi:hypothetical protein
LLCERTQKNIPQEARIVNQPKMGQHVFSDAFQIEAIEEHASPVSGYRHRDIYHYGLLFGLGHVSKAHSVHDSATEQAHFTGDSHR